MISGSIINLLLGTTVAPAGGNPDRNVAQAAIVAALGTRVGPLKTQQGTTTAYATVKQVGGQHGMAYQGPIGQAIVRVQILIYALDTATADAIADNVRKLFNGYSSPTWQSASPAIQGIFVEDDAEEFTPPIHSDEVGIHPTSLMLKVIHGE